MAKLVFEVQSAELVDEESSNQFAIARIHAFSSGLNRHNLTCDVETLKKTAHTLYEKPVVFDYDPTWDDFVGHVEKPFVAGFVVPNSAEFVELEDGRIGLTVLAKIWKYYSRNFVDIFAKDSEHKRKVSVEMELNGLEEDEKTGIGKMLDFVYTAVAVLGTFVTEASPGAHMQMVSFAEVSDKETYFKKFAKYDEIDFTIPSAVKKNCVKGLEMCEKFGRGGTSVGLATARYLSKNEKATPQRVRNIAKFFAKNRGENLNDKESDDWISWMLWGSYPSKKWSAELVNQMDMADEELAVYFEKENVMPYSSMKDVNPAIKGIKPPVTLAQANQIAKEAEGIGSDDDKNGWAIAISNFKKRHKVVDGRWVKAMESTLDEENEVVSNNEFEEKSLDSGKEDMTLAKENETFVTEEEKEESDNTEMAEEEKPEEEEKEEMQEEESDKSEEEPDEDEDDKTSMTEQADAYARVGEVVDMLEGMEGFTVPEGREMTSDELIPFMHQKMIQMSAQIQELQSFKEEVEEDKLQFEVNEIIDEIHDVIPEGELTALVEKVSEFSLETLDGWKNLARAKAFEFAKKSDAGEEEVDYVKYAIPFNGGNGESKTKGQPFS